MRGSLVDDELSMAEAIRDRPRLEAIIASHAVRASATPGPISSFAKTARIGRAD